MDFCGDAGIEGEIGSSGSLRVFRVILARRNGPQGIGLAPGTGAEGDAVRNRVADDVVHRPSTRFTIDRDRRPLGSAED